MRFGRFHGIPLFFLRFRSRKRLKFDVIRCPSFGTPNLARTHGFTESETEFTEPSPTAKLQTPVCQLPNSIGTCFVRQTMQEDVGGR